MNKSEQDNNWGAYYTADYFSGQGVDSPYPADGRYLNPEHPIVLDKFVELHRVVMEQNPVRHGGRLRLLDIGCGPAHTETIWRKLDPSIDAFNSDGFESVAKFASDRGASRVFVAGLTDLPVVSSYFGVVTIWDVIEHVPELAAQRAVNEAYRVLADGGVVAIRTPNKYTWTNKYRKDGGHLWFATPGRLAEMFAEAGFSAQDLWIKTRGFPGTRLWQRVNHGGDIYSSFGGGVIVATAKKRS